MKLINLFFVAALGALSCESAIVGQEAPAPTKSIGTPQVLPRLDSRFEGNVGRTYLESDKLQFPQPVMATALSSCSSIGAIPSPRPDDADDPIVKLSANNSPITARSSAMRTTKQGALGEASSTREEAGRSTDTRRRVTDRTDTAPLPRQFLWPPGQRYRETAHRPWHHAAKPTRRERETSQAPPIRDSHRLSCVVLQPSLLERISSQRPPTPLA